MFKKKWHILWPQEAIIMILSMIVTPYGSILLASALPNGATVSVRGDNHFHQGLANQGMPIEGSSTLGVRSKELRRWATEDSSFKHLTSKEQELFINLMGGSNLSYSGLFQKKFKLLSRRKETGETQTSELRSLLEPKIYVAWELERLTQKLTKVSFSELYPVRHFPRSSGWTEKKGVGRRFTAVDQTGAKVTRGVSFDESVDEYKAALDLAQTISFLPLPLWRWVSGIRVSPFEDVGATTAHNGVVDVSPNSLRSATMLAHEAAHAAWFLQPATRPQKSEWEKAAALDGMKPSRYAQTSLEEHVAEVGVIWARIQTDSHGQELQDLFSHQVALFERLLTAPPP